MAQTLIERVTKQMPNGTAKTYAATMVGTANRLGLNVRYVNATATD